MNKILGCYLFFFSLVCLCQTRTNREQQKQIKTYKTKKASSFEEAFVPGAGVEPARFPTGV